MREANSVTMESMQERVSAIQQKHSLVLEKMKSGWEEERQKWKREKMQTQKDVNSISVQVTICFNKLSPVHKDHFVYIKIPHIFSIEQCLLCKCVLYKPLYKDNIPIMLFLSPLNSLYIQVLVQWNNASLHF